jgi:hypothetical protein
MTAKITFAALLLSSLLIAPIFAKTITDEKSGVSIDLPDADGWKLEEGANPTATCAEGVSLIVIHFDKELPDAVIKRLADALGSIMKDAKASDDAEKITVHGLDADKVSGYAMRDEKAVKFTAVLISKDKTNTLAIIAVGNETPFKRHLRDIDGTLDSIRPKE